jgi:hypothetical protein
MHEGSLGRMSNVKEEVDEEDFVPSGSLSSYNL